MLKHSRGFGTPDDLAGRVKRERERREWSLDTLAEQMPHEPRLSKTAIFRIESGDRPVRVTELIAFARAFEIDDPLDLLTPLQVLDDEEARALIEPFDQAIDAIMRAADRLWIAQREITKASGHAHKLAEAHAFKRLGYLLEESGRYAIDERDAWFNVAVLDAIRSAFSGGLWEGIEQSGVVGDPVPPPERTEGDHHGQR